MIARDAIELIQKTAQQAQAPQVVTVPGEQGQRVLVYSAGQFTEYSPMPPYRSHTVYSLEDLIQYARQLGDADDPVIWHSLDGVTLILDDSDRRAKVTFPLSYSDAMNALKQLERAATGMDQRSFVRLLKFVLGVDAAYVTPWRKLDWRTQVAASGETAAGRDRMGREITAEVAGTTALPEELSISLSIYRELCERRTYTVRAAVEIDAAVQQVALRPYPGELDAILEQHQADLRDRLLAGLGNDFPIYYGQP